MKIDTSAPPSVPARKVEALKPDLLLAQEHHMCPGCGEPLAVRQFLESISELDAVQQAIAVAGIGCYTSFSGSMDVDLVQALHGLSPDAIAYVACDPVALARDLGTFRELGWSVDALRGFDLFPHSHHFEVVARLVR